MPYIWGIPAEMHMAQYDIVCVIEMCKCDDTCKWHTRHDPKKYDRFRLDTWQSIHDATEGGRVLHNYVPRTWIRHEYWRNKYIWDDDPEEASLKLKKPATGAFEVSTVIDGVPILLYSKLVTGQWPRYDILGKRVRQLVDDKENGMPANVLAAKYGVKMPQAESRSNRFETTNTFHARSQSIGVMDTQQSVMGNEIAAEAAKALQTNQLAAATLKAQNEALLRKYPVPASSIKNFEEFEWGKYENKGDGQWGPPEKHFQLGHWARDRFPEVVEGMADFVDGYYTLVGKGARAVFPFKIPAYYELVFNRYPGCRFQLGFRAHTNLPGDPAAQADLNVELYNEVIMEAFNVNNLSGPSIEATCILQNPGPKGTNLIFSHIGGREHKNPPVIIEWITLKIIPAENVAAQ